MRQRRCWEAGRATARARGLEWVVSDRAAADGPRRTVCFGWVPPSEHADLIKAGRRARRRFRDGLPPRDPCLGDHLYRCMPRTRPLRKPAVVDARAGGCASRARLPGVRSSAAGGRHHCGRSQRAREDATLCSPPQAGEAALPENLRPRGYCTLEARGVQVKMCLR
jgi:hypothetical protein